LSHVLNKDQPVNQSQKKAKTINSGQMPRANRFHLSSWKLAF